MQAADLKNKTVAIWGTGIEGQAAARYIRRLASVDRIVFLDESAASPQLPPEFGPNATLVTGPENIARALEHVAVLIKSPGVPVTHPLLQSFSNAGGTVTSLLNLWSAEPRRARTVLITGTKGKSTTASLLGHILRALGKSCEVVGNIGVPLGGEAEDAADFIVVEVSSFQAANFSGHPDVGVLTSLFPEHLDWHGSISAYYEAKLNMLMRAKQKIILPQALGVLAESGGAFQRIHRDLQAQAVDDEFRAVDGDIFCGSRKIGRVHNSYLQRPHNLRNVCAVLAVSRELGLDPFEALRAMDGFIGLPHRQMELGERDGRLFVDDSISTTPETTIAALEVYSQRPVALIVGGFDRGIDISPLANYLARGNTNAVICMGQTGGRLYQMLRDRSFTNSVAVKTMTEAVQCAVRSVPKGGVILLSPGAPSYDLFRNFVERGQSFAIEAGFLPSGTPR